MVTLTNEFIAKVNALLVDAAGLFDGAELVLFTNTPEINADTVAGDLTAPTFTTYAPATIVAVEASDFNGRSLLLAPPTLFVADDAVNLPQDITGAGILDSAGDLVAAGLFAIPIPLTHALQQFHVTAKLVLSDSPDITFEAGID